MTQEKNKRQVINEDQWVELEEIPMIPHGRRNRHWNIVTSDWSFLAPVIRERGREGGKEGESEGRRRKRERGRRKREWKSER